MTAIALIPSRDTSKSEQVDIEDRLEQMRAVFAEQVKLGKAGHRGDHAPREPRPDDPSGS